jgi:hypothetical protein
MFSRFTNADPKLAREVCVCVLPCDGGAVVCARVDWVRVPGGPRQHCAPERRGQHQPCGPDASPTPVRASCTLLLVSIVVVCVHVWVVEVAVAVVVVSVGVTLAPVVCVVV